MLLLAVGINRWSAAFSSGGGRPQPETDATHETADDCFHQQQQSDRGQPTTTGAGLFIFLGVCWTLEDKMLVRNCELSSNNFRFVLEKEKKAEEWALELFLWHSNCVKVVYKTTKQKKKMRRMQFCML